MKTSMKTVLSITFVAMVLSASAQSSQRTTLIRLYEDNDFFNLSGHGTDFSYSAGTRLDIFYRRVRRARGLKKIMSKVKKSKKIFRGGVLRKSFTTNKLKQYPPTSH